MFIGNTRNKFTMDLLFPPSIQTPQVTSRLVPGPISVPVHGTRCLKSNFTAHPEKLMTGENCELIC